MSRKFVHPDGTVERLHLYEIRKYAETLLYASVYVSLSLISVGLSLSLVAYTLNCVTMHYLKEVKPLR